MRSGTPCAQRSHVRPRPDRWYRLDLDLLADTLALKGARPLVAFVCAPVESLTSGHVEASATDYSGAGTEAAFLRISGFDPQHADAAATRAYRSAVDAFAEAGVPAVADAVGRFGLVLSAAGAAGFSSGVIHHQAVPRDPIYEAREDEMWGIRAFYEVPSRWYALDYDQARTDAAQGLLPACPEGGCTALTPGADAATLKEHMVHYFTREVRTMAGVGATAARQHLARHPRGASATWMAAL